MADPHASTDLRHLYVHVPFCVDRCTYCAFTTVTEDPDQHAGFVQALLAEWRHAPEVGRLKTLYLGGGTPAQLTPAELDRLLSGLLDRAALDEGAEVTLEANPANVTEAALEAWGELGITRLSLGIQTFEDEVLRSFGRHHDAESARNAARLLAKSWPGTWSADLLVGWAGQETHHVSRDTSELVDLGAPHISVYGLTLEPGTSLAVLSRRGSIVTSSDAQTDTFDAIWEERLIRAGLERYEVSNFARPGHRSEHNQAYWRCEPYLGLGPGASSSWGSLRWSNRRALGGWSRAALAGRSVRERCERVSRTGRLLETLAVGLRTLEGVPWSRLEQRFGYGARDELAPALSPLLDSGHLTVDADGLRVPATHRVKVDHLVSLLAREAPFAAGSQP